MVPCVLQPDQPCSMLALKMCNYVVWLMSVSSNAINYLRGVGIYETQKDVHQQPPSTMQFYATQPEIHHKTCGC